MGVERHSLTMKRFIVESLTIECHWIINDAWCLLIWSSTMINHNQPWKSAIISHDQPLNTIDISWFNTRLRWATKAWHRSRGSGEGVDTDCEPTTRQSRTGEGESSQDFFSFYNFYIKYNSMCFFSGYFRFVNSNISSDGQMEHIGYSSMLMDFTISITAGLVEPPKNSLTEGTAVRPESRQVNFTIAQVGEILRIFWLRYAKRWVRLHGKCINDRPAHEV